MSTAIFYGIILGMESTGAKYIKYTPTHIYFDVPREMTDETLQRCKEGIQGTLGLGLKVRRVDNLKLKI